MKAFLIAHRRPAGRHDSVPLAVSVTAAFDLSSAVETHAHNEAKRQARELQALNDGTFTVLEVNPQDGEQAYFDEGEEFYVQVRWEADQHGLWTIGRVSYSLADAPPAKGTSHVQRCPLVVIRTAE